MPGFVASQKDYRKVTNIAGIDWEEKPVEPSMFKYPPQDTFQSSDPLFEEHNRINNHNHINGNQSQV
ncbi:unnamed protein product [Rotaria magnacalcarata]|uniref:Uncharacterized protein n=1 Tax=Rotaria magnacalcarata TaxID=392030 RepID=A0A8S3AVR7_9BILA|nr:unnamed protein product [Rotaria magnacalcarata]